MKPLLLVLSAIRTTEARNSITKTLRDAGHRVVQSDGYAQARLLLSNGLDPDLFFVESPGPAAPGFPEYWELLLGAPAATVCVVHGGDGKLQPSEASKLGIRFFLNKPITQNDVERLMAQMDGARDEDRASDLAPPIGVATEGSSEISDKLPPLPLIEELADGRYFLAASPTMLKIYRQVRLLADVDAPVLILGESGSGKEVIAHLIHKHSRRSQQRFLNVNCAALPADLLESELFGYQRGAFTGAIKDKPGKFELANRGTLLLDEIGEMSAQMQAKLLHVLQDGQFTRLGARETSKVNVRVLAATNIQIESALLEKTFREDLYYRLNVFTIKVPPLRERREEIPYLIEESIRRFSADLKICGESTFSSRLMDAVLLYDWRGNVRELQNFVTRTVTMRDADSAIREFESKISSVQDMANDAVLGEVLPTSMRSAVREMRDRAEAEMIKNALEVSGWNRRHAARALNISYRGLLYKIRHHCLTPRSTERPAQRSRTIL